MSILSSLSKLAKDAPASYVFELSEAGLAYARPSGSRTAETGLAALEPGTLTVSPVADNIRHPEGLAEALDRIAPQLKDPQKRRTAALILPDYAVRVSVLDFDSFPLVPEEQTALVRFRLKKTLPYDIDAASVSHYVQPKTAKNGKTEVVAVTVAMEILARYEAVFRGANFHPGEITTSALASLQLHHDGATALIAKLAGLVLTVMLVQDGNLKLFRCVELENAREEEILNVLQPTIAYAEDELAAPSCKLVLCGFLAGALSPIEREKEVLRSRLGTPGPSNAGLLGYLEGARN